MKAQVVQTGGGVYTLDTGSGLIEASLRGRIKQDERLGDRVVIGDRVEVQEGRDGAYTIEAVEPRETWLVRRTLGGRRQKVVAANLERLLVVASVRDPVVGPAVIDRLLVMGEAGGLSCVLILTKVDLLEPGSSREWDFAADYREAGYPVLFSSVVTGEGMDEVADLLCRGSAALVGPSGVGKSSLVNCVEPAAALATAVVGRRSRAGRHPTVSGRLVRLSCGGRVADTPGFSDVGLGDVDVRGLAACFPELRPHLSDCRFRDCTHVHEPGCAVREAVERERVPRRRYDSYVSILEEIR